MPVVIPVCLSILSAISYIFFIPNSNSNDFIPVIKSLAGDNREFKFECILLLTVQYLVVVDTFDSINFHNPWLNFLFVK